MSRRLLIKLFFSAHYLAYADSVMAVLTKAEPLNKRYTNYFLKYLL